MTRKAHPPTTHEEVVTRLYGSAVLLVSATFAVSGAQVLSQARMDAKTARARQVCMYLLSRLGFTREQVAKVSGRHRTVVQKSIAAVEQRREKDTEYSRLIMGLEVVFKKSSKEEPLMKKYVGQ